MAKEMMDETLVGLALVVSFVLIVSMAAAVIPEPPPIPSTPADGSGSGAPPTPGTPGSAGSGAPPIPGTPGSAGGGTPLTPGVPPTSSGDSDTSSSGGGSGDTGRRHAGDTYGYAGSSDSDSSGSIETSPREGPIDDSSGYVPENFDDTPEPKATTATAAATTAAPPLKKQYVQLIILVILILFAIAAIIWAVMRWRSHHEQETAEHEEMKAVEKDLYLNKALKKETPSQKKPGKGPLPPGMR